MRQPTLFDKPHSQPVPDDERLVLYALGNFQARGKVLAERDLPLDRLRGALRRATDAFGVEELEDERAVHLLASLGAQVQRRHSFAAKHPYHIIVPQTLAEHARIVYEEIIRASASSEGQR
jgi:hypothetical protein